MSAARNALVVGCGISGPAMALALQHVGIQAAVYEARAVHAGDDGAFLTIASNGIDALRAIDADACALSAGFETPTIVLRSTTGKRLGSVRTGTMLVDGTTSRTIKRGDIHRGLYDVLQSRGIEVQHGKRLIDAEQTGDCVRATFSDGSQAVADVLIGCDGVHSAVRRIIAPGAPAPTYAGLITIAGYAEGVAVDAPAGAYEMIFGKRAFFGYVRAPHGDVWWFANIPARDVQLRDSNGKIAPRIGREQLLEAFCEDAGPAESLIRATSVILPATASHCMPHLPKWHNGRMIAVGDAAHAPSPTSGQGASLAIEDAVVLARCMRDSNTVEEAFDAFEKLRRARVERIIRWAMRTNSSKAAGPLARVVRDAVLPIVLNITGKSRALQSVFDYHVTLGTSET